MAWNQGMFNDAIAQKYAIQQQNAAANAQVAEANAAHIRAQTEQEPFNAEVARRVQAAQAAGSMAATGLLPQQAAAENTLKGAEAGYYGAHEQLLGGQMSQLGAQLANQQQALPPGYGPAMVNTRFLGQSAGGAYHQTSVATTADPFAPAAGGGMPPSAPPSAPWAETETFKPYDVSKPVTSPTVINPARQVALPRGGFVGPRPPATLPSNAPGGAGLYSGTVTHYADGTQEVPQPPTAPAQSGLVTPSASTPTIQPYDPSGMMAPLHGSVTARTAYLVDGEEHVPGHGDGTVDTVPAMLAPGEAVLNKPAAEHLGRGLIKTLNKYGETMMQGGMPVAKSPPAGAPKGYSVGTPEVAPKPPTSKDAAKTEAVRGDDHPVFDPSIPNFSKGIENVKPINKGPAEPNGAGQAKETPEHYAKGTAKVKGHGKKATPPIPRAVLKMLMTPPQGDAASPSGPSPAAPRQSFPQGTAPLGMQPGGPSVLSIPGQGLM